MVLRTPEFSEFRPEYIESLKSFVRSRPAQPVAAFLQQSTAAITHDAELHLGKITAPTQITFGRHDTITSTRFADRLTSTIRGSELMIWSDARLAAIYENVTEFNQKSLAFFQRHVL